MCSVIAQVYKNDASSFRQRQGKGSHIISFHPFHHQRLSIEMRRTNYTIKWNNLSVKKIFFLNITINEK
jgi:hypothetical protein